MYSNLSKEIIEEIRRLFVEKLSTKGGWRKKFYIEMQDKFNLQYDKIVGVCMNRICPCPQFGHIIGLPNARLSNDLGIKKSKPKISQRKNGYVVCGYPHVFRTKQHVRDFLKIKGY